MSEDTFNLDEYQPRHDDVDEYLDRGDTPIDYKKSPADGAIEHRQAAKGESSGNTSTKGSSEIAHRSKMNDMDEVKSITQEVRDNRDTDSMTLRESEAKDRRESNDPADWD
jgi:hypothetical protein